MRPVSSNISRRRLSGSDWCGSAPPPGAHIRSLLPPESDDSFALSDIAALDPTEVAATPLEPARVKWFDKGKGFGFANVFGRSEDIFLHMEVLRRSGLSDLAPGEALALRVIEGKRGHMAAEVFAWEAALDTD